MRRAVFISSKPALNYKVPRLLSFAVGLMIALSAGHTVADVDPISPQRKDELQHMVVHDCGACHGITLKGGLGPNITASALQSKPDRYLFDTIANGRAGTPMPPWLGILTEQEIHYLVELLTEDNIGT